MPDPVAETLDEAIEWLRRRWDRRKRQQAGELVAVSMAELIDGPQPPPWEIEDSETQYRRGYSHGIQAALDAMEDLRGRGYHRISEVHSIIYEWACSKVLNWRYKEPKTSMRLPPNPDLPDPWSEVRRRTIEREDGMCQRCESSESLEVHHRVPVKHGGLPDDDNLEVLCRRCHRPKAR